MGDVMISKLIAVLRDEKGFTAIAACVMIAVSQLAASL